MTKTKRTYIILSCLALALILFFLPVEFPRSIDMQGRVVSAHEWLLVKDPTGRIFTILNDRVRGVTESFDLNQFEREDAVQVRLATFIRPGAGLVAGDTIGIISSADTERLLSQLQGELASALAALDVVRSGEKPAIIKEAEQRLDYSRKQLQGHTATVERMRTLRDRGIVSSQEFEPIETQEKLYQSSVAMAEAQLNVATTGAKSAEITLSEKNIMSLEQQIAALGKKLERFILRVPFSGIIFATSPSDTLVFAGDSSRYAVVFPVRWQDRNEVHQGSKMSVTVNGLGKVEGTVASINRLVHAMQGEQFVLATVLLETKGILPGLMATCSVPQPPVTVRSFVTNLFGNMFSPSKP